MKFNLNISRRCSLYGAFILLVLLLLVPHSAHAQAGISLDLSLGREQVFAGENVAVMVTLRTSGATVRNIGYPNLLAPGGARIEFDAPSQTHDAGDDSTVTYRFTGRFVAKKPGTHQVGPAALECEVFQQAVGSAGFFGGMDPRTVDLDSPAKELKVSPLPSAGRPANFSGGVGSFRMAVRTRPDHAAAGEPLTILTTITGTETVADALCPEMSGPGIRSYPAKAVRRSGALICEQVIIPERTGPLPQLDWSYFDPQRKSYVTHSASLPNAAAAGSAIASVAAVPLRAPEGHPAKVNGLPEVILASISVTTLAVILAAGVIAFRKHRENLSEVRTGQQTRSYASMLTELEKAMESGDVEMFYRLAFRILQSIAGDLLHRPPQGICSIGEIVNDTSQVTDNQVSDDIIRLFQTCDRVRFGRFDSGTDAMAVDLEQILRIINKLHLS